MDMTRTVLESIWHDIRQGAPFLLITVFLAAMMCAFAAARNQPTLWRDVPGGLFWGWLAAMAAAVTFLYASAFIEEWIRKTYEYNNWRVLQVYALCTFGPVCLFAGAWFRVQIKQRRIRQELGLSPLRHRWFAISLRTLMLIQLGLVLTIGGWYSFNRGEIRWRYSWKQRLAWRETVHARFNGYGWHLQDLWKPLMLRCDGPLVGFNDQVLAQLQPDDQLQYLQVDSDQLTNGGMNTIAEQTRLTFLNIKSANVTDQGVAQLTKLPQLDCLILDCPKLTDAVLSELQHCPKLKNLLINRPEISPEALAAYKAARPDVGISVRHPWPPVTKPSAP